MAISDKLDYLIETKSKLKNSLNLLGAEITASTTFRNYITWLDNFYTGAANKTDIAINGIEGRTSQETTTGKNLFNKLDYTQITTTNNSSPTNIIKQNDYISFTSSGSLRFSGLYIPHNSATNYIDNFNTSTNYYISFDVTVDKACKFGGGQTTTYIDIPIGKTRLSFYGTITGSINFYVRNAITDGVNVKIENIMVSTESDTTYEPYTYGASPNSDYPQPINNLTGNVSYKITTQNGEQTFTIPLGDIELGEITTYKDKIYSSDGRFYLKKEINKINSYNGEIVTTDYKSTTGGLDTGATVYYGINTITTEITSSNYSALYAALKEIQDYLVSYKINKEFLLDYSSPEIEY